MEELIIIAIGIMASSYLVWKLYKLIANNIE